MEQDSDTDTLSISPSYYERNAHAQSTIKKADLLKELEVEPLFRYEHVPKPPQQHITRITGVLKDIGLDIVVEENVEDSQTSPVMSTILINKFNSISELGLKGENVRGNDN